MLTVFNDICIKLRALTGLC